MSDANRAPGDPIEENPPVDDVVGRAHEGLADAEAAQRGIDGEPVTHTDEARHTDPATHADSAAPGTPATSDPVTIPEQPVSLDDRLVPEHGSDTATRAYAHSDSADSSHVVAPSEPVYESSANAYESPTRAYESNDFASAPTEAYAGGAAVGAAAAAPVAPAPQPQPIFVQAPEEPRPRGNRGAAGGIGLLAALAFAVLYLAAFLAIGLLNRSIAVDDLVATTLSALTSWWLWITSALFFVAFWLLGAIINTGRWAHWVIWGLLVGVASYAAHIAGQFFQAPFWQLTRDQGVELFETQAVAPLAFVAFVIGRELTVWFGAWVAARGRRVSELNEEARREYERTLEAGPQLVRP